MRRWLVLVLVGAAACGGGGPAKQPAPIASEAAAPEPEPPPPPPAPPLLDPIGLWPIDRARERLPRLAERGAAFEPEILDGLASATVRVGECAGAFVSSDGLIATSLSCVQGSLWRHGGDADDGFLAHEREDELASGPELELRVLVGDDDVTEEVRDGLEAIDGDAARGAHIEERVAELLRSCRSEHVDCEIAAELSAARFRQLRFLVIPDVRVAYAPPRAVAAAGPGERGRWPRAAAGVALVRAYVGPDGAPSVPVPENEPFLPDNPLRLAPASTASGDAVAMAGFPARSYRDEILAAFEQERSWRAPRRVRLLAALHDAVYEVLRDDPDSEVARHRSRALAERRERAEAALARLEADAERRRAEWEALEDWLAREADAADEAREAIEALQAAHRRRWQTRERDASIVDLRESAYYRAAQAIVSAARARREADSADPWGWRRLAPVILDMPEGDHPAVDRAALGAVLDRAARWANINRAWLRDALDMSTFDADLVDERADALYADTSLDDPLVRERYFETATADDLEQADDPFLRMALALEPQLDGVEVRRRQHLGASAAYAPAYHRALAAARGEERPPDANGSLRVSFGRIRGYRPDPDEGLKPAMLGEGDAILAFIASADGAGGFAGAPVVDERGGLIGVAVERVAEALGSEWGLAPQTSRMIFVHVDHLIALLREAGAERLLDELGAAPADDAMTPASD